MFDDAANFLEKVAVRGVVGLERGAGRGNQIQGVMALGIVKGYDNDRKLKTDIRNSMKTFDDWTPGVRLKMVVEALGSEQSLEGKILFYLY